MNNIPTWEDLADEAEGLVEFLKELYDCNEHLLFPVHLHGNMMDWLRDYRKTVAARRVEEDQYAVG